MSKKTGRAIVIKNNKVLLIERFRKGKHYYTIPGGKKEKHEDIEETIVREVFEETGIEVEIVKRLGKSKGPKRTHYLYVCNYIRGKLVPENNWKANKSNTYSPVWLRITEAKNAVIQPKCLRNIFKSYLQ